MVARWGPTFTKRRGKVYRYYLCIMPTSTATSSCPVRCLAAGEIERTVVEQVRAVLRSPEILAQTYRGVHASKPRGTK